MEADNVQSVNYNPDVSVGGIKARVHMSSVHSSRKNFVNDTGANNRCVHSKDQLV
jgi:hypothetical protein